MKILHSYLFYSIKFAGGTSDLMFKLHKAQLKYNIDSFILTGNYKLDANLVKLSNDNKVIVFNSFLDKYGFSIMPGLFFWGLFNIRKFDLVHMHVYRTYQNIILYFLCKLFKIPYVMDAHGSVPLYTNKRYLKIIFDYVIGKKILNDAKFLIAETQTGVQEYMNLLPDYNKPKIIIISPPFDTDEFKVLPLKGNFRKKWKIDTNSKVIIRLEMKVLQILQSY
jgi:glycosyltransferase involved in cell wall biosynthesis